MSPLFHCIFFGREKQVPESSVARLLRPHQFKILDPPPGNRRGKFAESTGFRSANSPPLPLANAWKSAGLKPRRLAFNGRPASIELLFFFSRRLYISHPLSSSQKRKRGLPVTDTRAALN